MAMTSSLLRIVDAAHSQSRILDEAACLLAQNFHVDACSVFLLDERGRLARAAKCGLEERGGDEAEAEARLVAERTIAERSVVPLQATNTSLLASPMIVRGGLVGVVVLQNAARCDFSADDVAALATSSAQLVTIVEAARIIEATDRGELRASLARAPVAEPEDGERLLRGVAASPGVGIGTALFRGAYRLDLAARAQPRGDPAAERARMRDAIVKTRDDLVRIQSDAAREIDEEHALIFASHLLLLNDPMILGRIDEEIARGAGAPAAVVTVFDEFESRLRTVSDAYIQEKIEDVDDLRSRLLGHLLSGKTRMGFGERVVLSRRIAPSLVIELKTEGAQGLATEIGGETSHGVLLARAMSIPAVTGIADVLSELRPDDRVIVDGTQGLVVVRPTDETMARYEAERRRALDARAEWAKYRGVLARTADGVRVTLYATSASRPTSMPPGRAAPRASASIARSFPSSCGTPSPGAPSRCASTRRRTSCSRPDRSTSGSWTWQATSSSPEARSPRRGAPSTATARSVSCSIIRTSCATRSRRSPSRPRTARCAS
jgi:phosphohistidine swiveling domain-containing protein/GAF domain-containing protein